MMQILNRPNMFSGLLLQTLSKLQNRNNISQTDVMKTQTIIICHSLTYIYVTETVLNLIFFSSNFIIQMRWICKKRKIKIVSKSNAHIHVVIEIEIEIEIKKEKRTHILVEIMWTEKKSCRRVNKFKWQNDCLLRFVSCDSRFIDNWSLSFSCSQNGCIPSYKCLLGVVYAQYKQAANKAATNIIKYNNSDYSRPQRRWR